ncbi:MAG: hypothetical protein HY909_22060 [Deltaproteobacteria bacterium]|nr:hypothetical protein [Deltaproteobacteria bacterium]
MTDPTPDGPTPDGLPPDPSQLLWVEGALVPCSILLEERTGPIFARHRYETRIALRTSASGLHLEARDLGEYQDEVAQRDLSWQGPVPREAYLELWNGLLQAEVFSLSRDFVGALRGRPGIVPCCLELTLGEARVRFDYLLSQVHSFAFFKHRSAIHAVKGLLAVARTGGAGGPGTPEGVL